MKDLKIAFLLEEFALQTPAQQLLDRFLIGYPRDGEFHKPEGMQVTAHLASGETNAELDRRVKDYGLVREQEAGAAAAQANALVIVPRGSGATANESLIRHALEKAPAGCCCFVYGALSNSLDAAKKVMELAAARKSRLCAGTSLPATWRLPDVDLQPGTPLPEALIVVHGTPPAAELDGLEGLWPVIERRRNGESGIQCVQFFKGDALWQTGRDRVWSWPLLAAAISRSDSPQGDPVKDGRTQNLAGLGLVPGLARDPRGWVLQHRDGLKSTILVLDGVIADYSFAVQAGDGTVTSAQLYRPPAPAQHQFSRLAAVLEDFTRPANRRGRWKETF